MSKSIDEIRSSEQQKEAASVYGQAQLVAETASYLSLFVNIALGLIYQQLVLAVVFSGLMFLVYFSVSIFIQNTYVKSILVAIILSLWPGTFIVVSGGLVEARSVYFAYLLLVCVFQNRVAVITAHLLAIGIQLILYFSMVLHWPWESVMRKFVVNTPTITPEQFSWTLLITFVTATISYTIAVLLRSKSKLIVALKTDGQYIDEQEKINLQFAHHIAENNLTTNFTPTDDNEMGMSLVKIRESIIKTQQKLQEERRINDYKNEGALKIDSTLRQHFGGIDDFSQALLNQITSYLDADLGSFFVVEGNQIALKASHAHGRHLFLKNSVMAGEGLVGTAYLERELIFMTDIPANYMKVETGTVSAAPRSLLILPILGEAGAVVGVLEIMSVKLIEQYKLDFLQIVAPHIGGAIEQIKAKQQANTVLQQSQIMTAQKEKNEKELEMALADAQLFLKTAQDEITRIKAEAEIAQIALVNKQKELDFLSRELTDYRQKADKKLRMMK